MNTSRGSIDESFHIDLPDGESNLTNDCSHFSTVSELVVFKSRYAWTIQNFDFESVKKIGPIEAPIFTTGPRGELKWRMILECVEDESSPMLRICMQLLSCKEVHAQYGFSLLNDEESRGQHGKEDHLATMYSLDKGRFTVSVIPVRYLLCNQQRLLPGNRLTIISRLSVELDVSKSRLSGDLGHLLESEKFSDVKLLVGGEEFPVHKNILASRSPVFAAMFEYNMIENSKNIVEITDIEARVMRELIKFIYTERADGFRAIEQQLYEAADKYALEDLKAICEDALYAKINIDNAVEILVLADLHNSMDLKNRAKNFIVRNAEEVMESAGYKAIGESSLHLLGEIFPRIE